jgi:uncharacterized protein YndB with AHSA1/START domain
MSLKKDASGRRYVQVEVEVPGTPEQVWEAIATGPGISAWFVPTVFEERDGKPSAMTCHFGPGMDSAAKITEWDPPRRLAAESAGWTPEMPSMATEWTVEARAGGTCVVRVVHSLFASTDDWDNQLASTESGWPVFFHILRLYLTHFRGQRCASYIVMGMAAPPVADAWSALRSTLGLTGIAMGGRWRTNSGAPPLGGVVESIGEGDHPHQLLRLDEPGPGVLALNACEMGGKIMLAMSFYWYGDGAAAVAAREEPRWQTWLAAHAGP